MAVEPLDFDALIGEWRRAFEAARAALEAARHDFPPEEYAARSHRLTDERAATASVLDAFARERQTKHFLVRLVATSWESKRLLGVPADALACVFNVDGVLVPSASIHAEAWRMTFDEFIARHIERTGVPFASFSVAVDYPRLVHGRSRVGSVHEFLASRGITLPDGTPDDPPGTETVSGLASRKNQALLIAVIMSAPVGCAYAQAPPTQTPPQPAAPLAPDRAQNCAQMEGRSAGSNAPDRQTTGQNREPLGDKLVEQVFPGRRNYGTSRIVGNYFRLTKDLRLVWGGRARFARSDPASDAKSGRILEAGMRANFPLLAQTRVDYCWGGLVDMTKDRYPRAGREDGVWYAMGYSGHGAQMSTHLGIIMADTILGRPDRNPLKGLSWPAVPGHFGRPWFLPLVGLYYKALDRIQ